MDEKDALNGVELDNYEAISAQTTPEPHAPLAKRARIMVQDATGAQIFRVQFWPGLEEHLWRL